MYVYKAPVAYKDLNCIKLCKVGGHFIYDFIKRKGGRLCC